MATAMNFNREPPHSPLVPDRRVSRSQSGARPVGGLGRFCWTLCWLSKEGDFFKVAFVAFHFASSAFTVPLSIWLLLLAAFWHWLPASSASPVPLAPLIEWASYGRWT